MSSKKAEKAETVIEKVIDSIFSKLWEIFIITVVGTLIILTIVNMVSSDNLKCIQGMLYYESQDNVWLPKKTFLSSDHKTCKFIVGDGDI